MATNPKTNESTRVKKLIAGANQHLSGVGQLTLNNVSYTLPQLLGVLQGFADLCDGVQAAKSVFKDKLSALRTQAPALRAIVSAFVEYVRAAFGTSSEILGDFGLSSRKAKAPQTAEEKALAVQKRNATRAARHTMGKREKAKIHGTVPQTAPNGAPAVAAPGNGSPAPAPVNAPPVHPTGGS